MSVTTTTNNQISILVIMIRAPNMVGWSDDLSTGADRVIKRAKGKNIGADKIDLDPSASAAANALIVQQAVARLAPGGKLYLLGHADWASQKCGDKDPDWVAEALQHIGNIGKLSLLGCSLARDANTSDTQLITSVDSFASRLHVALGARNVYINILARVFDVKILADGKKTTVIDGAADASLSTPASKRATSKLLFYWEGKTSRRKWVEYGADAATDNHSLNRDFDLLTADIQNIL